MSYTTDAIAALPPASATDREQLTHRQSRATEWFSQLQNKICNTFEGLERDAVAKYPGLYGHHPGQFTRRKWRRDDGKEASGTSKGGGEMALMTGALFEKVGVNISTVWGEFSEAFRENIPGASQDPRFWASGISLVAHMRNPFIPAIHMNTRFITTTKQWFGGGIDLTPAFPCLADTTAFHHALKDTCMAHDPTFYERYKAWCDQYFFLPHRDEARGVGGLFYDYLNRQDWDKDFAYTQDIGRALCKSFVPLVEQHMSRPWTADDDAQLLQKRGRYVEFNLLYDRGTLFGLKTGGNTDAILMSLPPRVTW